MDVAIKYNFSLICKLNPKRSMPSEANLLFVPVFDPLRKS